MTGFFLYSLTTVLQPKVHLAQKKQKEEIHKVLNRIYL
jgi:hypothetical protein